MPTAAPDTLEATLARALATQLAAWDIVTYRASGEYQSADVRPLYLGPDEPANAPAERVLLTVSPVVPLRGLIGEIPVSFNYRGAEGAGAFVGLNFAGLLRRRLHKLAHFTFGTVPVGLVRETSAGSIGRDGRRRPGATANYLFRGQFAGSVNT